MKICYLILAHKNAAQLNMLVEKLLEDKQAVIYMHISIPQYFTLKDKIVYNNRLHILDNPIEVKWGGDNILKAQLKLLEASIYEQADYYQFLTGQDFPIKKGLGEYLQQNRGQIFIDAEKSPREEKVRIEYKWPYVLSKMYNNKFNIFRIIRKTRMILLQYGFPGVKKKIPKKYKKYNYYKSMFWITIDYETAKYCLDYLKMNPDYFLLYKDALNAEEGFWATTIMNNNKLYKKINVCKTLMYIGEFTNNHPKTLTSDDKHILEESDCFFARKFDSYIDMEIIKYFYNI